MSPSPPGFTAIALPLPIPELMPTSSPSLLYGPYIDYIAVGYGTLAVLAALRRRRRTGMGCYIDLSMAETTIAALPEPLLAWTMNGDIVQPRGNRDPVFAPQGCYPAAAEDRWPQSVPGLG